MSNDSATVLVVDDNEGNRYTLNRRLRRLAFGTILEAADGRAALATLAGTSVDLVLLDIMMPEMNGYEVLERIKADTALRDIPVIMISAIDEMDSVVRCIELGAEDYLPKPFNATLLKARIAACLDKKRLRDREALYLDRLEGERARADSLLHAILPAGAVRELKATNEVLPRRFEGVVVLFCDLVGFTAYCDRTPPEKVVGELQQLVIAFEEIVERHQLEKIKTIGDAFLATAGLLHQVADPVQAAVHCGLAMAEATPRIVPGWQVRVGIHVGPVVAGIVGRRQFLYDLWGDTVNVAARISEHADPGHVLLSADGWAHVRHGVQGRSRGLVELKGKGGIELVVCSLPAPPAGALAE